MVKINNQFVHDFGPFDLQHGDYLHVIVGPLNDEQCVSTRFAAAALHNGHAAEELPALADDPADLRIDLFPNQEDYLDTLHFDDRAHIELMQRHLVLNRTIQAPATPAVCRNGGELQETLQGLRARQDEADDAREAAEMRALEGERPVIRDLHGHWLRVAIPWGGQLWAPIQVWYISHANWRICPFARTAWLGADFTLWYQTILDSWNDQIDPLDGIILHIGILSLHNLSDRRERPQFM